MPTKTSRAITLAVAALALAGAAAGCSSNSTTTSSGSVPATTPATNPAPGVTVSDAWARTSPAAVTSGAAYLTLVSTVDDGLVKAEAPTSVAAETQLHETVMGAGTGTTMAGAGTTADGSGGSMSGIRAQDGGGTTTTMAGAGEMSMREVSRIDLPAGEKVELKPGGYHIMLVDLVAPLEAGQTIEITLTFEKAGTQKVTATVRDS